MFIAFVIHRETEVHGGIKIVRVVQVRILASPSPKKNSMAFSPQANHADRATAACR
jgi:hypothetical protein